MRWDGAQCVTYCPFPAWHTRREGTTHNGFRELGLTRRQALVQTKDCAERKMAFRSVTINVG
jgi:hypothetical protein